MNRLVLLLILYLVFISNLAIGQVGIGTTNPNKSSILDISSVDKGMLIPRTDTLAIVNPAKGLIICDTATSRGLNYFYYNGVYWQSLGSNAGSFADTFNGDRIIKRPGWAGVSNVLNAGTKTNVVDFLNAIFFPFLSATISINANALYEIGTSNSVTISGSTTVREETIFSNGRIDQTYPTTISGIYTFGASTTYSTSITFTPDQSIASTLELRFVAYQGVGNNGNNTTINSSTKLVQSCYPYLYGVSLANLTVGGTTTYTGLSTKLVQAFSSTKTALLTGTGYLYFCYPASYGTLTSILDQNGWEQILAFNLTTTNVTSSGLVNNWTQSYHIYQSNNTTLTIPAGWNYQFKY